MPLSCVTLSKVTKYSNSQFSYLYNGYNDHSNLIRQLTLLPSRRPNGLCQLHITRLPSHVFSFLFSFSSNVELHSLYYIPLLSLLHHVQGFHVLSACNNVEIIVPESKYYGKRMGAHIIYLAFSFFNPPKM